MEHYCICTCKNRMQMCKTASACANLPVWRRRGPKSARTRSDARRLGADSNLTIYLRPVTMDVAFCISSHAFELETRMIGSRWRICFVKCPWLQMSHQWHRSNFKDFNYGLVNIKLFYDAYFQFVFVKWFDVSDV